MFEQPRNRFAQANYILYHEMNNVNNFFMLFLINLFGFYTKYYDIFLSKNILTKRKRYDIMLSNILKTRVVFSNN